MYWIEGWVEVTYCHGSEQDDEYAWQSLINILTLINAADSTSERLFGLSKRCTAREVSIESLAAGRGAPPNPSAQVKAELNSIKELEQQYGPGECGGYTHATWQEIKSASIGEEALQRSDWKCVFDLVRHLEQSQRYSDDQVRFVVWLNW